MKVRITYIGSNGTMYSELDDMEVEELGHWHQPFPNEKGNPSPAFGLEEGMAQSDYCPRLLREEGIDEIKVEAVEPAACPLYVDYKKSCVALREHNKELGK